MTLYVLNYYCIREEIESRTEESTIAEQICIVKQKCASKKVIHTDIIISEYNIIVRTKKSDNYVHWGSFMHC